MGIVTNAKRLIVMWGRAGRQFVGVFIIITCFFVASTMYNVLNTDVEDRISITEEELRVLKAFRPPITLNANQEAESEAEPNESSVKKASGPKVRSDALLQHLQQTCTNFNITLPVTDFMLSHMHVDHKRKAVYCFTPKVACTSWKRIWMKMTGLVKPEKELSAIDRYVIHTSIPTLATQKKNISDIMASYKKFMFVRHPFDRVLSAFKDKLEQEDKKSGYNFHKEIGARIQRKYRSAGGTYTGANTTFPEFIRFISEPGRGTYEQRNEHWLSVHEICNPCRVKYDFIGKYESLKEDTDYVLDWLNVSSLVKEFPTSDRPFHARRYDPKYFNQLDHTLKVGFFQKYLTDFVAFDYTFL